MNRNRRGFLQEFKVPDLKNVDHFLKYLRQKTGFEFGVNTSMNFVISRDVNTLYYPN